MQVSVLEIEPQVAEVDDVLQGPFGSRYKVGVENSGADQSTIFLFGQDPLVTRSQDLDEFEFGLSVEVP